MNSNMNSNNSNINNDDNNNNNTGNDINKTDNDNIARRCAEGKHACSGTGCSLSLALAYVVLK